MEEGREIKGWRKGKREKRMDKRIRDERQLFQAPFLPEALLHLVPSL